MARIALNRRFTLEAPERLADGAGGYTVAWVALGEVWAAVDPGRGGERARDTLEVAAMPARITVRAVPPERPSRPRPGQRFREPGRVFRILAVAEADAQARFLVCDVLQEEIRQ